MADWKKGTYEEWMFEGRKAVLVKPKCAANGKWAIYTEYFWAFPDTAEELLARGWHVAGLDNINRWGLEADQDARHRFLLQLHAKYGLERRCVPIGMSCGGLHATKYAGMYPEDVAAMYLDAPVVNLLSCPMRYASRDADPQLVAECLDALDMTETQLLGYRGHPLDYIPILTEHRIPIVLLYGDQDREVPYEENGALLEKAYLKADVPIRVICKPGCAHHPHGLERPDELADMIEGLL